MAPPTALASSPLSIGYVSFVLSSFVLLAMGQGDTPVTTPLHETVCGTKFVDPSSSALMADIVLQGSVEDLRQASPLAPLLYKANVTVHKVYKGQELLARESGDSNRSDRIARKPRVGHVEVERFGPDENRENCVARVSTGQAYLFFLRMKDDVSEAAAVTAQRFSPASSSVRGRTTSSNSLESSSHDPPLLVITALPLAMDLKSLRQVKKVLCPGCSSVPVIKRLRCKHCAAKPTMKRKMSANSTRTIKPGKRLSLRCVARGSPRPSYTWLKNGQVLHSPEEEEDGQGEGEGEGGSSGSAGRGRPRVFRSGSLSIRSSRQHSLLVVKKVTPDDQGMYRCLAANAVGEAEQSVRVMVERAPRPTTLPSQPRPAEEQASPSDGPCATNPCYNGGTCSPDEREPRRARCQCQPDYHGRKCQFKRRPPPVEEEEDGGVDDDDDDDSIDRSLPPKTDVPLPGASHSSSNNIENTLLEPSNSDTNDNSDADPTSPSRATPIVAKIERTDSNKNVVETSLEKDPTTYRKAHLTKKQRRKHTATSAGGAGNSDAKSSKSGGAPQLKISPCPDPSYCFNGGICKIVVKIQRRFCECPRGFAGRRCERRVL